MSTRLISMLLTKIHDYLKDIGYTNEECLNMDKNTITLSKEIMMFAHKDQYRENGERYENHPLRVLSNYHYLLGIDQFGYDSIDKELLKKYNIPFEGVEECILLHDVIEDSDLSIDDLESIFTKCGYKEYFLKHIKTTLKYLTHDKNVDYDQYILILMQDDKASLIKLMDLRDNTNILTMKVFDEKHFERLNKYIKSAYLINLKFQYIENAKSYRDEISLRK